MKHLKLSIIYLFIYTLILGVGYPVLTTILGQLLFSQAANGSVVLSNAKAIGSTFIGQQFTAEKYFWGRPSATSPNSYNSESSSGSNLALTNPNFKKNLIDNAQKYGASEVNPVPIDLVTSSGSGLDPEISVASALFQIKRIAKARTISEKKIKTIIDRLTQDRFMGVFGEARVNVLALNIELDKL